MVAKTHPTTDRETRSRADQRRLRYLIGALTVCGLALPLTRLVLLRRPAPPPPATATTVVQRNYWRDRITVNVADVEAYVRLGEIEEKNGFYTAATKYLRAARALGASDRTICGPLGRALTQLARDDEALPELEKALAIAPDSVEAATNLAGLYINQNQSRLASEVLERFVASHPTLASAPDAERLALCFLECGNRTLARRMAERALEIAPESLVSRSVAARGAMEQKDYPTARRHLEAMLAQNPKDAAVLYLYALVLQSQGEKDRALVAFQKTVALNPGAMDAFVQIGDAYARRGDMRHAAIAYERVALAERSREAAIHVAGALSHIPNKTTDEKGKAAYWNAVAAGFSRDFPAAIRYGQEASRIPATHRQGLQAIAEAYRGMARKADYLRTMETLTSPGTADDLLLMAQAWGEADEPARRTEFLQRALAKADPANQPGIHGDLAETYRKRGMRDDAERELETALRLDPKNPRLYRQLAEVCYERRMVDGRLRRAITAWETAIALDPNDETDWQRLGSAYVDAGDTGKAARCLEHAIDLEPGFGAAYLQLGQTYAKIGDKTASKDMLARYARFVAYDQERQTLQTRARRSDATADDLSAYGDFLRRAGFPKEALGQYEQAARLRPNDQQLREKLNRIYQRLNMPTPSAANRSIQ